MENTEPEEDKGHALTTDELTAIERITTAYEKARQLDALYNYCVVKIINGGVRHPYKSDRQFGISSTSYAALMLFYITEYQRMKEQYEPEPKSPINSEEDGKI